MNLKVLIVDDDNLVCRALKIVLGSLSYTVETCEDATRTFTVIDSFEPDIILLDIYLTVANGLEVLAEIKKRIAHIPVIMITAFSDVNMAVKAMKLGAYDFLIKPIETEQLESVLKRCAENITLKKEVHTLQILAAGDSIEPDYFGKSKVIQKVVAMVDRLSRSDDTTILFEGESGVGKEVFSRFLHQRSPRRNKVFVSINCAAIPKELAESELFGHEKGAFTGAAQKTKPGKFELAAGGTILLDEIGELSLDLQVKLLRVLQERKFYRLAGEKEISVNVRVIAATNKNLEEEVNAGRFREDLFYRLNVARITIPPLRKRKEDIPLLADRFVQEFNDKFGVRVERIDDETQELLTQQYWKGNIRELRNVMERAMLMIDSNILAREHIAFIFPKKKEEHSGEEQFLLHIPKQGVPIDTVLRTLILKTLELTGGNQVRASKLLGLSRSKLRYRMEQLGIAVTKKIS